MACTNFGNVISAISNGDDPSRSSWYVRIPTLGGGIVAHVRHNHWTGALWVACADDIGVWYREFDDAESYVEWLDYIRSGDVEVVDSDAMPRRYAESTFKPRAAA